VLKNQFLCDTYTPEAVIALQKIKNHLEVAKREAVEEHERVLVKLQEYSSLGLGFESIVKQYTQLLEEIKNKRWALSELQKQQPQEER
jgi:HAUS augmin-like complex subunit 4